MALRDLGTVIVTGGASGLGAAVCEAIAAVEGTPVALDRRQPRDSTAWEEVDLADTRAAEAAVARVARDRGRIDGVVTAAGIDVCGRLDEVAAGDWERVVAVNLLGTVAVIRAALPHVERSRGHVVTVGSTLGLRAMSDATAYCASKFGVVGFTRALASETAGRIGVTLLIPGGMQTSFFNGREEKYRPPDESVLAPPEEVAQAVVFALTRPAGAQLRELVVCPAGETSWP